MYIFMYMYIYIVHEYNIVHTADEYGVYVMYWYVGVEGMNIVCDDQ